MAGHTPFRELTKNLSPERRAEIDRLKREIEIECGLGDVRRAAGLTQVEVAEVMEITQGVLSRFERSGDFQLSTLTRFAEALGMDLEITFRPKDSEQRITLDLSKLGAGS